MSQAKDKFKQIHALLQAMPQQGRQKLLGQLKGINPKFAPQSIQSNQAKPKNIKSQEQDVIDTKINQFIPEFSCLQNLSSKMIQKVFHSIERTQWLKALKIAEPEFKEYLLNHLSVRVRADLAEDLRLLGPVRLKDASEACEFIIKHAWDMERKGIIKGLTR
jgi:flagellar motor switch protein FliG